MDKKTTQEAVKKAYGTIARNQKGCGCCDGDKDVNKHAQSIGYSEEELMNIPKDSNLALSCGNPNALAHLKEGEVVLDLGSGAGFDCFIAAKKIGSNGKVIGVDMTPEMIDKAKENAIKHGFLNVEFKLGEIENLPIADSAVDVVISNCVINLSADKSKVFEEIYRVLKPGGRIAISDIVLRKELPEHIKSSVKSYVGCISGAILADEYKKIVESSGLKDVKIMTKDTNACVKSDTSDPLMATLSQNIDGDEKIEKYAVSANIEGYK